MGKKVRENLYQLSGKKILRVLLSRLQSCGSNLTEDEARDAGDGVRKEGKKEGRKEGRKEEDIKEL